jgi:hypothetical protein
MSRVALAGKRNSHAVSVSRYARVMRDEPAGDVNYDETPVDYAAIRRPEPRFAEAIRRALGDARSVINVGAGAGSYEPTDRAVTPVEPSAAMRAQRPAHLAPAVDAAAENLPFDDQTFDAAMATVTVHQWKDLDRGLGEVRRVTRGPVVIMTFDPLSLREFWLTTYAPEMMSHEHGRMPSILRIADQLGGDVHIGQLPIPSTCRDGFVEAFFSRPEALLDSRVRQAQSAWSLVSEAEQLASVGRLQAALGDGSWDEAFGHWRTAPEYPGSLRLIVSHPN